MPAYPKKNFPGSFFFFSWKGHLLIWALVYAWGMHPDVSWGDGMGYVLAVQQGYDLATNANSHFLYLVAARAFFDLIPGSHVVDVLRGLSLLSALMCLYLAYLSGKRLKDEGSGIWSMTILAACFSFWRHACIIEVYTFALCFWGLWWFGLLSYLQNRNPAALWIMALAFSLGILAHIQMLLLLPAWVYVTIMHRKFNFKPFLLLLIPLAVFYISVEHLKTNSWTSVFTDQIGTQLFQPDWRKIGVGPFFTFGMFLLLFPAFVLFYLFSLFKFRKHAPPLSHPVLIMTALLLAPVLGFASLYPEPGIHVFYLPAIFVLSTLGGYFLSQRFALNYIGLYPVLQVLAAVCFTFLYGAFFSTDVFLSWKGGPAYLFLPWARGNATSVIQVARKHELSQLPEPLHWNVGQAKKWIELVEKPASASD